MRTVSVMRNRICILAFACPIALVACGDFAFGGADGSRADPSYHAPSYDDPGPGPTRSPPDAPVLAQPTINAAAPGVAADTDAGTSDAGDSGAPPAGWPSIDATVGALDRVGCPDDATRVGYLMSETGILSRFDPATLAVTRLGIAACATVAGGSYSPSAMAASRSGMLYVLYTSWNHYSGTGSVYAIDPTSLQCTLTPWTPLDLAFDGDVGIAVQRSNGGEALLVLGLVQDPAGSEVTALGRSDLGAMTLSVVAKTPLINYAEGALQADVYDRLFRVGPTGSVARLDPATGAVLEVDAIPGYAPDAPDWSGTAMVMGQDIYAFDTRRETDATLYRYNLVSKATTAVVQVSGNVAAATASPCSP